MSATHWTDETTDPRTLAQAFLFRAPPAANDLRITLAREYAARATDAGAFWDALAEYVGKGEAARLRGA